MGRRKIEMTIVKNRGVRQVTFSKRRMGVFKKAKEISILCAAQVAILVFSIGGKPYSFGYPNVDSLFEPFVHLKKLNENLKDMKGKTIHDEMAMMINIMKKYSKKRRQKIIKMEQRKYKKVREFPGARLLRLCWLIDYLRDKLQSRINEFDASNSLLLLAEGPREDRRSKKIY